MVAAEVADLPLDAGQVTNRHRKLGQKVTPVLEQLAADGCQTKAPSGGECAGKSPVGRAGQGVKRSQLTGAYGIPMVTEPAPADIRDHRPTQP
ncbi:hypothetical protein GCM10010521_00470 [Streptomyces rameus]|uniref:Transposase n=1 Tax=Streptomyces rameus TaxID=68261 RepID=A0ABP6MJD8_9ACTN